MSRLHLTFACGDYDRTRALEDGSVRPDGIDLTYLRLPVEETFFRMLRHREFDVAEMSLSTYVATLDHDPPPFVALPVFTSRMFRHGGIYVNADAGIEYAVGPARQAGRFAGVPADRGRVDPGHPRRTPRRASRFGDATTPAARRRRAGSRRARSTPAWTSGRSRRAPRCRRCWPTARSTRSTRRGCRARSATAILGSRGCSTTSSPSRRSTSRRPASSRSCTWS